MSSALLKKEIRYRASRRGMRELDLYLESYISQHLESLDEQSLTHLRDVLLRTENELFMWFTNPDEAPAKYRSIIRNIKAVK